MAEKANCYTSNKCGVFTSAENDCKLHVSIIWMIVVHSYVFLEYAKAIATAIFFFLG